jgi:hypothetical protein
MTVTIINKDWIAKNKKEDIDSIPKRFAEYQASLSGTSSTLQATKKTAELVNEIRTAAGLSPYAALQQVDANVGTALSAFNISKLYPSLVEAKESLVALSDPKDKRDFSIKVAGAIKNSTGTISTYISALMFAIKDFTVGSITSFLGLCGNITELFISTYNYSKIADLEAQAAGEAKDALSHSKYYHLLSVIKAVVSAVSAIFGCMILSFGAPQIVTIALLIVSLSMIALSIHQTLYKSGNRYPIISPDQLIQLGHDSRAHPV